MLTPEYLLHCSENAEHMASLLHADLLKRIIARVQARQAKGLNYILTASDKWAIQNMQDSGYLLEDINKEIAKYTGYAESEIKDAMLDAGVETIEYDDRIYRQAGLEPTELSPHLMRLMERNYNKTLGEWKNFTGTTATATQQTFINAVDEMYMKVSSGGIGYIQAYVEAIDKIASEGIIVTYPSGHTDTIETATLRCVRTGISQTTAEISMERMNEMGINLVLVSSHMGARPEHEVWQGQVYSLVGATPKYDDFWLATGYGTGEGLCGWNCRHSFMPYVEGMDNPFKRYDDAENRELYEDTQKQRAMERSIRKSAREVQGLEFAVKNEKNDEAKAQLTELLNQKKQKLGQKKTRYKEFCDEKGFRPLPERLRIAQAGRRRPWDNVKVDDAKPITPAVSVKVEAPKAEPSPIGKAVTIKEAEEHAKIMGLSCSYKGVDVRVANEMNLAFESGISKCPAIKDRMGFVGSGQERNRLFKKDMYDYYMQSLQQQYPGRQRVWYEKYAKSFAGKTVGKVPSNCYAFAAPGVPSNGKASDIINKYSGICVNEKNGKDYAEMLEHVINDVKAGFHPEGCGSIRYIFDHEVGHQLDYALNLRDNPDIKQLWRKPKKSEIRDGLSIYGAENIAEFIAEAYAEYCNNPTPRKIAKAIGKIIEDLLK